MDKLICWIRRCDISHLILLFSCCYSKGSAFPHYYFSLWLYCQELNLLGTESVSYTPVKGFYILWGSWVPYKKLLSCCATYIDMIDRFNWNISANIKLETSMGKLNPSSAIYECKKSRLLKFWISSWI